ncbi:hypothetical protein PanWU01x14_208870 [Parasponia andersonii]|uniref:Uncharacterized protein n=1 Tax=Parasponia andersonii TaxID=3476 RepID=A0A2P5BUN6_PARAD|nr:hypothetical protein PanWU01x14_208870 [Parasponia andersonii]
MEERETLEPRCEAPRMGSDGSTPLRERKLLRFRRVRSVEIKRRRHTGRLVGVFIGECERYWWSWTLDIGQLAPLGFTTVVRFT